MAFRVDKTENRFCWPNTVFRPATEGYVRNSTLRSLYLKARYYARARLRNNRSGLSYTIIVIITSNSNNNNNNIVIVVVVVVVVVFTRPRDIMPAVGSPKRFGIFFFLSQQTRVALNQFLKHTLLGILSRHNRHAFRNRTEEAPASARRSGHALVCIPVSQYALSSMTRAFLFAGQMRYSQNE